jgi:hypothetical protein
MRWSRKDLSKSIVTQEVVMREAEGVDVHKVLNPPLLNSLSDSTDPSIMLDLIAAMQRKRALD